jgi:hypothetical protein
MITLFGKPISDYAVLTENDGQRAKATAIYFLTDAVRKRSGHILPLLYKPETGGGAPVFEVAQDVSLPDEYYSVTSGDGGGVTLVGGRRGIIYAALSFAEEVLGIRFYADTEEYIPYGDVSVTEPIRLEPRKSAFIIRDTFGRSSRNPEFLLKARLNFMRGLDPAYGGTIDMIQAHSWHSLSAHDLLRPYVDSNPEFFALIGGKRKIYGAQICFSSEGALNAVTEQCLLRLRKNPRAQIVSVSLEDTWGWCECPDCLRSREKGSYSDYHFSFVNKVARAVGKEFPNVHVHTFAYHECVEPPTFKLEPNVLVQYCMGECKNHSISDESCARNAEIRRRLTGWGKKAAKVMLWVYSQNHTCHMIPHADTLRLRENFRFYAENNIVGVFNENDHNHHDGISCFDGLRTYLFSSLMRDPYMSEEKFNEHIDGFCAAYYGPGGGNVKAFLRLFGEAAKGVCVHFNSMPFNRGVLTRNEGDSDESRVYLPTIPRERTAEVCGEGIRLLDAAIAVAKTDAQRERLAIDKQCVVFYELFFTMEDILNGGSDCEKAVAYRRNQELIDNMIRYNLKYTMYRGTWLENKAEISQYGKKPPNRWGYVWTRDPNK